MGHGNEDLVQQFVEESKGILKGHLEQYGLLIYSNKSTLRRNPVLFYGVNPGGDPARNHATRWTIDESLDVFSNGFDDLRKEANDDPNKLRDERRLHEDCNLIDDQRWPRPNPNQPDSNRGRQRYQNNTRDLLTAIGHRDALITNLLFLQTTRPEDMRRDLTKDEYKQFKDDCWDVHKLICRITEPKVIVTCASVVDGGLKESFSLKLLDHRSSGYANWLCKHWEGTWNNKKIVVLQIGHPSYYKINAQGGKHEIAEWAKGIVAKAIA